MEFDPSILLSMDEFSAPSPSLSPFNQELLMRSIVNNDKLVRSYQEKCADLQSFIETANQVQVLYRNEKEEREKLQAENVDLNTKLNRLQERVNELENEKINTNILNKQTTAEYEDQIEKMNKKYLDLCESYVEQANILSINQLTTAASTRKCTAIKEYLLTNGVLFDWDSPKKQRRKSSSSDGKTCKKPNSTRTYATQTDTFECIATPKPVTCEKSTQYQQSKTTRSTCTSAFIRTIESATNTEVDSDNEQNVCIESALHRMVSHPLLLSPIREATTTNVTTNSTQTMATNYRTQGTLTLIHNVRKRVNYAPIRSKSERLCEVKKEENPSPCASPSPFSMSSQVPDDSILLNTQFHHYWKVIGDLLCRMLAGQGNMLSVDENQLDDIRIIQNLLAEKGMYRKPIENNDLNDEHCAKGIDCNDEHSRDSMESYNSDKIVFSQIRNLNTYSPVPEENSSCSTSTNKQNIFTPIASVENTVSQTLDSVQSETEIQTKRLEEELPKQPAISKRLERNTNNNQLKSFKRPLVHRENLQLNNRSSSTTQVCNQNDVQFKVPKRKTTEPNPISIKKQKTNQVNLIFTNKSVEKNFSKLKIVNFQKQPNIAEKMKSLFGDLSDEEDQIEEILDLFRVPKMLSPIKDLEYEPNSDERSTENANQLNEEFAHESAPHSPTEPSDDQQMTKSDEISNLFKVREPSIELEQRDQLLEPSNELALKSDQMIPEADVDLSPSTESGSTQSMSLPLLTVSSTEASHTPKDVNVDNWDVNQEISETIDTEMVDFDDYSPASPKPDEQISTLDPPTIPIDTIVSETMENSNKMSNNSTESTLDQIIYNYTDSIRHEVMMPNLTNDECYLLASLRNAIEKYCHAQEWTSISTTECVDKLLSLSRLPKHLSTSILEVVEDTTEDLSIECTPPAPVLKPSHQKCVLLVSRLTKIMPPFNKYIQFELERRLFTFEKEKPLAILTNLAHFYIAIVDIEQPSNRNKVRLFIYKCLYYYKLLSIPLVFIAIMAHPYVLPHASEYEHNNDPLIRAIMSTLSCIIYTNDDHGLFKKREMYHTLKRRYGFFADKSFSADMVVDHCMECIRLNRLQHVDYALILIAKRKDCEYAIKQIIEKHLLPMLHQLFSMNLNATNEHDEKICMIIFTIGSIVKTFPIEHDISGIHNIFATCLNATKRQSIQEAAVLSICQLSRFGIARTYQLLKAWKPNYEISPHIQTVLRTIVYRKSERFWFHNESN